MRLFNIPKYVIKWYKDSLARLKVAKKKAAKWAIAEILCMSLSLFSLFVLIVFLIVRATGGSPPYWMVAYFLPVLLAGAVGYLTNLIAITMLFRPYGPGDNHPAGIIPGWRQGLVPEHKAELAKTAGKQVSDELLTAEVIADEVKVLIERALEDDELQDKLRYNLGPVIREKVPDVVKDLMPEIMKFLRGVVGSGFDRKNLDFLFEKVLDPWLKSGKNKKQLVKWVVSNMRDLVPVIVEWLQVMAEKYKQRGFWKKATIKFAEWTGGLDWDDIHIFIEERIADRNTRNKIIASMEELLGKLKTEVGKTDIDPAIKEIQERASDFVSTVVEDYLGDALPDLGHRIADDRKFWRWLSDKALPSIHPYMISWLEGDGIEIIKENFDVAGRIESAINKMDVQVFHRLINDASARHLGAIQVLGYMLGIIAGGCLLLT